MECATCLMVEPKRNRLFLTQSQTLYVGQCIGRDTVRIQMDNPKRMETRGLEAGEDPYDEQLTLRCLPQFGGAAA